jgi:Protein of unknown function (DUF3429)
MGSRIPLAALLLGLAGAVPFVVLTAAIVLGMPRLFGFPVFTALIAYGAVILSFLGGVRWGWAMREDARVQAVQFTLSVVPSLIGWIALLLPPVQALSLTLLAMLALGISDVAAAQFQRLPPWYGKLRLLLSAIVSLSLAVALLVVYRVAQI